MNNVPGKKIKDLELATTLFDADDFIVEDETPKTKRIKWSTIVSEIKKMLGIGTADISDIGDGTIKGAIIQIKNNLGTPKIDGRNWARGTGTPFVKTTGFGGSDNKTLFNTVYVPENAKAGDEVTISFDYETSGIVFESGKTGSWKIEGSGNLNGWGVSRYPHNGNLPINQKGHWSYTTTLTKEAAENDYWNMDVNCANIVSGYIKIWNYKFEKGSKETSWTPSPEDLLNEYVTPQMFGAKGDGVADDTNAFKKAVGFTNGVLLIPNGTYLITQTLTIDRAITIIGENRTSTKLKYNGSGYLFDVKTNCKDKANIKNLTCTGNDANSFLTCNRNAWGSSVDIDNLTIDLFGNTIFDFVSSYGVKATNIRIVANGKIVFRPFDTTKGNELTFSNVNIFENVYFTGYPNRTPLVFDMDNNRSFHLYGCAFENCGTVFKGVNDCNDIYFCNSWVENATYLYDFDKPEQFNWDSSYVVGVTRYNKKSVVYDLDERNKSIPIIDMYSANADTYTELISGKEELDLLHFCAHNPKDTVNQWAHFFQLTTKKLDCKLPKNIRTIFKNDVSSISYDLHTWDGWQQMACIYHVNLFISFSDYSVKWQEVEVISFNTTFFAMTNVRTVKKDTWGVANSDKEVISLDGSTLKFASANADIMKRCYLIVKCEVIGSKQI